MQGTTDVTGDTFTGNTRPAGGGAIDNDATLNISDSTFTGNTGGTNGGGAVVNFGTTTVTQSTFSGNSSQYGANILNYTGFTLKISMSIVANGQGGGSNCGGAQPVTDLGYNIDTGTSCGFSTANHSMSNTQPQLGPLASNGGPTQTMALPLGSPAVDAIPSSTSGCTGTTDQRGITRPQGTGCDIGAYELVQTGNGTPSVPTGLTVTGTTSSSVSLSWNPSTGNPTGYTVYRNGKSVGTTGGPNATTFTDNTVSPFTTYSYTVDAFSGSNHSAPVLAGADDHARARRHRGGAERRGVDGLRGHQHHDHPVLPGARRGPAGRLVRAVQRLRPGDGLRQRQRDLDPQHRLHHVEQRRRRHRAVLLPELRRRAERPDHHDLGVVSATFLEGAVGEYSGVATAGALDQVAVAKGNSTTPDSGATAAVGAGELVFGGIITGRSPGTVTPGASQGKNFTLRAQTSSESANAEDILSSAAGAQDARATFSTATDWYAVVATFHAFKSPVACRRRGLMRMWVPRRRRGRRRIPAGCSPSTAAAVTSGEPLTSSTTCRSR